MDPPFAKASLILATVLVVFLAWQAFLRPVPSARPDKPVVEEECVGAPIIVDYPFQGGFLEPHACKVQCEDDEPRYILYSNGKATQCEMPPGCNDGGEDRGVTCRIPADENANTGSGSSEKIPREPFGLEGPNGERTL